MDIFIAILITAPITSIIVYEIMIFSNNKNAKKFEESKKHIKAHYENLYFEKEDNLKAYYSDLLEKEQLKNIELSKSERKRYDKMLMEINESAQKDKQLLMIKLRKYKEK